MSQIFREKFKTVASAYNEAKSIIEQALEQAKLSTIETEVDSVEWVECKLIEHELQAIQVHMQSFQPNHTIFNMNDDDKKVLASFIR